MPLRTGWAASRCDRARWTSCQCIESMEIGRFAPIPDRNSGATTVRSPQPNRSRTVPLRATDQAPPHAYGHDTEPWVRSVEGMMRKARLALVLGALTTWLALGAPVAAADG